MAGNGLLDTLGSYVPDVLKGDSPAEQRMSQQGGIGGVLSNIGGLAGDVGNTISDYSPAGALKQAFSPQGAGLAALIGLGGAMAIHGYHQWKAGNLPFDERGSTATADPFNAQRMQPPLANPPSWSNTDYKQGLYQPRVDQLLHANTAEGVALALTKHDPQYQTVVGKHLLALQGFVNDLGDSLLSNVQAHGDWADQYAGGRPQAKASAAAWSLAQLDTAYHRGLIDSPQFRQDYERLITRAHTITDERQPLQQAAVALSKELGWTYSPDLALPAPLDLVGMRFTPNGVETTMAYRRGALPHDMESMDVWGRERALNYQALIPQFVDNKLHLFNNPEAVTEPYTHLGRSGTPDPDESRTGDPAWYYKAHDLANKMAEEFHLDPFEVAPAVVSALSPRAKWGANVDAARQLLKEYAAAKEAQGGVVTRPFLEPQTASGNAPSSLRTRFNGVLPESVYRAQRILLGEPVPEVLQALKMRNFGTNITHPDNPYPVTVDTLNQSGAFGYHTGNKNPVIFESGTGGGAFSKRGADAFEAHATADRLVARYTGLPTASAAQAKTWGPISYIANRVKGGFDVPGAPSSVRSTVLGWGNPGPGFIADQAAPYSAAGDVLAPAKQPELGRKGSLTAPAFVVTARPDGSFLVHTRTGEPGVREVLRTLRPLGVDGDPFRRSIPVVPRPVESAEGLRASIQFGAEGPPAASRVEIHNGAAPDSHSSIIPGNWFHYTVDGQDENTLHALKGDALAAAQGATLGVAQPHTVWEPDNPLVHLNRADIDQMGPAMLSSDQSPLNKVQWVGISAERGSSTTAQNAAAHKTLAATIRKMGYDPIETRGVYGGVPEKSYLVFGMPNSEAIRLAEDFGQESVATPSGLYYPAERKYREWDGEPTTVELAGAKGAKLHDNYGELPVGGKTVRYSRGYDWADDNPQSDVVDPDEPHRPTPKVRQELRVHLGPVVAPDVVQRLADAGRQHGVRMKAYLHGDVLKPAGFSPVAEHVFNDVASTVIHQGDSLHETDPNAVTAYLPEGDALGVAPGRSSVLDSARVGRANDISSQGVVNGELRVVTPDAELSPTNPLVAQVHGDRVSRFAMYLPDAVPGQPMELPELALGDDAREQLFNRQRDASRVVEGTIHGRTVKLSAPPAGAGQDMVLFHLAREYLARHGVEVGERATAPLPASTQESA